MLQNVQADQRAVINSGLRATGRRGPGVVQQNGAAVLRSVAVRLCVQVYGQFPRVRGRQHYAQDGDGRVRRVVHRLLPGVQLDGPRC